jgi:hypothetical protein
MIAMITQRKEQIDYTNKTLINNSSSKSNNRIVASIKKPNKIHSKYYIGSKTVSSVSKKKLDKIRTKKMHKAPSNLNNFEKLYVKNAKGEWVYKYYNSDEDSTINKNPMRCMCINYKSEDDFKSYDRCPNQTIPNSDFCKLHQNCKSYLQKFLSGDEIEPDFHLWRDPLIEGSHNCYSYFLNRQVKAVREKCAEICSKKYKTIDECIEDSGCGDLKPQPGDFDLIMRTGSDKTKERIYKCPEINSKIIADNPTVIPITFNTKCPRGYYKGAMTIEPDSTYHFYKQMHDGLFYHKPGLNPVSKVDSAFKGEKGRPIYIPHFANRDYSKDINNNNNDDDDGINYTSFCNYYCIPKNSKVHKNLA